MIAQSLRVTFLRPKKGVHEWKDGGGIGNHAKFFIIDDKAYYVGSQNLYIANLAEWGVLVDDENQTQLILEEYWKPMWNSSYNSECPDVDVQRVMDTIIEDRDGPQENVQDLHD